MKRRNNTETPQPAEGKSVRRFSVWPDPKEFSSCSMRRSIWTGGIRVWWLVVTSTERSETHVPRWRAMRLQSAGLSATSSGAAHERCQRSFRCSALCARFEPNPMLWRCRLADWLRGSRRSERWELFAMSLRALSLSVNTVAHRHSRKGLRPTPRRPPLTVGSLMFSYCSFFRCGGSVAADSHSLLRRVSENPSNFPQAACHGHVISSPVRKLFPVRQASCGSASRFPAEPLSTQEL